MPSHRSEGRCQTDKRAETKEAHERDEPGGHKCARTRGGAVTVCPHLVWDEPSSCLLVPSVAPSGVAAPLCRQQWQRGIEGSPLTQTHHLHGPLSCLCSRAKWLGCTQDEGELRLGRRGRRALDEQDVHASELSRPARACAGSHAGSRVRFHKIGCASVCMRAARAMIDTASDARLAIERSNCQWPCD